MMELGPVFVKLDEYKEVLDIVDVIKLKIERAKNTVIKLEEVKESEDKEIKKWMKNLEDANTKILEVKKALFEPR